MRLFSRVVAGVVLLALWWPVSMAAQARVTLGAGLTAPSGDIAEGLNTGLHGLIALSLPAGSSVVFQAEGMLTRMGLDNGDEPGDIPGDFQVIEGTVNLVYRVATSQTSKFHPYLIGGAGIYNYRVTGTEDDLGSNSDVGVNGGAGFDFAAGGVTMFVEGRFHNVFRESSDIRMIPVTVGIRLGGN